jgi:hypothetical protein
MAKISPENPILLAHGQSAVVKNNVLISTMAPGVPLEDTMKTIQFVSEAAYGALQAQSAINQARPRRYEAVRHDEERRTIALALAGGVELSLPVALIRELAHATPEHLKDVRLSPSGDTIVFASADVHIHADGLLADMLGLVPREAIAAPLAAPRRPRASRPKRKVAD